jgi:hypothetical protein
MVGIGGDECLGGLGRFAAVGIGKGDAGAMRQQGDNTGAANAPETASHQDDFVSQTGTDIE